MKNNSDLNNFLINFQLINNKYYLSLYICFTQKIYPRRQKNKLIISKFTLKTYQLTNANLIVHHDHLELQLLHECHFDDELLQQSFQRSKNWCLNY